MMKTYRWAFCPSVHELGYSCSKPKGHSGKCYDALSSQSWFTEDGELDTQVSEYLINEEQIKDYGLGDCIHFMTEIKTSEKKSAIKRKGFKS